MSETQKTKKITYKYGIMSSKYTLVSANELIAKVSMLMHLQSNAPIAIYRPLTTTSIWVKNEAELDILVGGSIEDWMAVNAKEVAVVMETIKKTR